MAINPPFFSFDRPKSCLRSVFGMGIARVCIWILGGGLVSVVLLLALNGLAQSQKPDRSRLEQQRNVLLEEINFTKQELEKVERQRKSSVNQLVTLNRQVEVRNKIIDNYEEEVSLLNREMEQTRSIVESLERDLQRLRAEYAHMLRVAQKRMNGYPDWMLILSADHLNQAFRRLQYLRQYQAHRKTQGEMIEMVRTSLTRHRQELSQVADQKMNVLDKEEEQRNLLAGESARTGELVRRLQQDEKTLRRKLREKEAARRELQRSIEAIIRRELELARKAEEDRLRGEGKAVPPPSPSTGSAEVFTLTPEARALGLDFEANRGRLPWPVARGFISESFGDHPHPVLSQVTVRNDGISIRTNPGSEAKVVFKGEVTAVVSVPGMQKTVIVRHGQYLSVYAHLDRVTVAKGEKVTTGQSIGLVYTDPEEDKTEIQLQIWKGTVKVDPQLWLLRR